MAKASAQPARVTLAIGNEPLFIERTVRAVAKAAVKDDPQAQRFEIAAGDSNGGLAIREACAPTLFGDTSVVIVSGIDSCSDEVDAALREVVTDFPDHVWLIVTHPGGVKGKNLLDALKKAGAEQVDCVAPKKGKETLEFLSREFASHKRTITRDGMDALYESLGNDIRMLSAAASQLSSDVVNEPITRDDVAAYFEGVAEVSGFAIADAVWDRRSVDALRMLRQAMLNSDSVAVPTVSAMAMGLRQVVRVAGMPPGASEFDIAKEAGVPPWKVKTLRRQWSGWSGDQRRLAAAAVALADADGAAKGGIAQGSSLDPEQKLLELERLVMLTSARKSER